MTRIFAYKFTVDGNTIRKYFQESISPRTGYTDKRLSVSHLAIHFGFSSTKHNLINFNTPFHLDTIDNVVLNISRVLPFKWQSLGLKTSFSGSNHATNFWPNRIFLRLFQKTSAFYLPSNWTNNSKYLLAFESKMKLIWWGHHKILFYVKKL